MIHICYGLHDRFGRYSKFVGASMLSIFENTKAEVTAHIFHDNTLNTKNQNRFKLLAENYNQHAELHNVEEICAEMFEYFRTKMLPISRTPHTIATLYRFITMDLLPADITKAIYLDADTIVNLDIDELWQLDLGEHPLAAVSEQENGLNPQRSSALCREEVVDSDKYFNSGVLPMNLDLLRSRRAEITNAITFVSENVQYTESDIFNYCFSKEVLLMPVKFNRWVENARYVKEEVLNNIYHYSRNAVNCNLNDRFNRLFMEKFIKSPWFGMDTLNHFHDYTQRNYAKARKDLLEFAAISNGRKRIFCVEFDKLELMKKLFQIGFDEKILDASKPYALKRLMSYMLNTKGRILYILLVDKYNKWKEELNKIGFVEGNDFIDATKFFSKDQGVLLRTNSLVQAL